MRSRWIGLLLLGLVLLWPARAGAEQKTVGGIRIVDAEGATIGQEPAPPGEKIFRLPAGVDRFLVALDFEGSAPAEVAVRVMGPSGTVLFEESNTYSAPDTYTVEVGNQGVPFAEQEYVVNVYVGVDSDSYLADSLQLVVGTAALPSEVAADTSSGGQAASGDALALAPTMVAAPAAPAVPGGPSWQILGLALVGILALGAIVVWAGWSAMSRK